MGCRFHRLTKKAAALHAEPPFSIYNPILSAYRKYVTHIACDFQKKRSNGRYFLAALAHCNLASLQTSRLWGAVSIGSQKKATAFPAEPPFSIYNPILSGYWKYVTHIDLSLIVADYFGTFICTTWALGWPVMMAACPVGRWGQGDASDGTFFRFVPILVPLK